VFRLVPDATYMHMHTNYAILGPWSKCKQPLQMMSGSDRYEDFRMQNPSPNHSEPLAAVLDDSSINNGGVWRGGKQWMQKTAARNAPPNPNGKQCRTKMYVHYNTAHCSIEIVQ
jgi:hypothetical protein